MQLLKMKYSLNSDCTKDAYIAKLNPDDVLCGRGSGPNEHDGNIRFRLLVAERETEYRAISNRIAKTKIAQEIVNEVLKKNGRFLKKVGAAEARRVGIPKGVDTWVAANDETIMEKVKQALRQNRDKSKTTPSQQLPISRQRGSTTDSNNLNSDTKALALDSKNMQPPAPVYSVRYPMPKDFSGSFNKLQVSEEMSVDTIETIEPLSNGNRQPSNELRICNMPLMKSSSKSSFRTTESSRLRSSLLDKSIDSHIFSFEEEDDEVSLADPPSRKSSLKKLPPIGDLAFTFKRRSTVSFTGSMISNLSLAVHQLNEEKEDTSRMSFMSISDRGLDDSVVFTHESIFSD